MKNKGYTLIELLGVIIILAVLITLVFPNLINFIKSSSDTNDKLTVDLVMNAAELFVDDNSDKFINTDGSMYCIRINTLIENNYLKGNLEYQGESLIGVKDLQLTYDNELVLELVNSDECKNNILYVENTNISSPDLLDNALTPVTYDGKNWVIADIYEEWYSYSKQEWANAVILNSSVKKSIGDTITVDGDSPDVLAMFVWIPRYEYKIEGTYGTHLDGTLGTQELPGEIKVHFITKDTKEANEGYIMHPAFKFGGEDISGIWVGKFELSHVTKTSSLGCKTETCTESDGLRILPNVQSLRNNNISNYFYAIRSMSKSGNIFGIDSSITDSHMIKNSEWGAAAYLSQSRYGKYGNVDYNGVSKEIYINNSSDFYTGRSGGSYGGDTPVNKIYSNQSDITTQYNTYGYYTYDGYLLDYNTNNKTKIRNMKTIASTTGNIYGIYDMSGGAWDYVMGVFANSDGEKWSGTNSSNNSGFVGKTTEDGTYLEGVEWPEEKYYDVYKVSSGITIDQVCDGGGCVGHALTETKSWYNDTASLNSQYAWFIRGGYSTNSDLNKVGAFYYYKFHGSANANGSTRVVFAPI